MRETSGRWTIGDVTLTALVESETSAIPTRFFFPDATTHDVTSVDWLDEGCATAAGEIAFRVQAFVIERPGRTVLVDPCIGDGKDRALASWNQLSLRWLDRFRAAGFSPDDVDTVVHTHLHSDHIGWDTHLDHGTWVPTFTRAVHVYVDDELEFCRSADQRSGQDPFADSIAPVIDAGLANVVSAGTDLGGGFRLVPTPGHTPGHTSLDVVTGSDRLVVTGDLIHHQFQMAVPRLAEVADWDADLAVATRRSFFDEQARAGTWVAGTHFPVSPLGRIVPDGSSRWRFDSAAADELITSLGVTDPL